MWKVQGEGPAYFNQYHPVIPLVTLKGHVSYKIPSYIFILYRCGGFTEGLSPVFIPSFLSINLKKLPFTADPGPLALIWESLPGDSTDTSFHLKNQFWKKKIFFKSF